ncbi:glycosyltransferase family 39 protein [Streptomyces griseocarneus]|uniref:glycosyltransferase family 39 protein n=1 Tax=Streptomyces griseocarneus TaxID=51201 RepID=UPI00167E8F41|nr:glycosyltransferase family 39 protein [Streptomyces griseocarneus]MBZ6474675.1 glycosyltransferase family 39 protein [Streptomyces griseocarneus]GHG66918.1 membrane protein [Streptomyces griseocarneus]
MTTLATPAGTAAPPRGRALRRAAPALLLYAAVRVLGIVALALWGLADGKSAHRLLSARWDSLWYARIAEDGYGYTLHLAGGKVHSDLAFFPLLPWLERALSALVPLSANDAGLVVAGVASLFAAWGIFAVGERLYGRRAGVLLVVLWAALPVGVVQSMAYSESLFTALAAWSVYAVISGRWVWAGAFAALAGLTRPVGAAVVAAVWITAAAALVRARRGGERPPTARLLLGVALAPLGWLAYFVWVGVRTGSPTGYLDVQGGWGNGFDGGLAFGSFVGKMLASPAFPAGVGLLIGVALVLRLYWAGVRQGQPLPLLVYGGTVLLLALTAKGYFGSKPRLMMPAFPLLLPLAVALARLRTVRAAAVVSAVALVSAVYGAFWLHGSGPP